MTEPKEGIFKLSYSEYDLLPAVRSGYLQRLDDCPAKALVPVGETPALKFGRALHCLVLEPERFEKDFIVSRSCEEPLKSGKNKGEPCGNPGVDYDGTTDTWYCGRHTDMEISDAAEFEAVLSEADYENMLAMTTVVRSHPTAKELIIKGQPEMTAVWKDEATGIWCKVLIDWLPEGFNDIVLDLKTCASASDYAFNSHVNRYGYHVAAAMRLEGISKVKNLTDEQKQELAFGFIAVEKEEPFRTEVYDMDETWLNYGHDEFRRLLQVEADCRRNNEWPAWNTPGAGILVKPKYLDY